MTMSTSPPPMTQTAATQTAANQTAANQHAEDLQHAALRLSELLEHEVALLRDMRCRSCLSMRWRCCATCGSATSQALQDAKSNATNVYHKLMHETQRQPDVMRQIDSARRDKLRDLAERLATATSQNAIALNAAIRAHQRVMQAIADAMRAQQTTERPYGSDGSSRRGPVPISISIDERL